jgi:predicted amidohydrolase
MLVGLIQNDPDFGDCPGNARRLVSLMDAASKQGRETGEAPALFVLPELCFSGYQFLSAQEAISLAEKPEGGPGIDIIARAAESLDAAVVFGFPERCGGDCFNSSMLLEPGGARSVYRKTHLFYKEKLAFKPGDSGFVLREFRGLRVGLAVCFDWFFPESFGTLARMGADLIAHCSNLVLPFCQKADFARAVENRVYVFTANRCGAEERGGERLSFSGNSVALSPRGDYLASLPVAGSAFALVKVDPALSRDKRLNEFNDLWKDRRPEFYK